MPFQPFSCLSERTFCPHTACMSLPCPLCSQWAHLAHSHIPTSRGQWQSLHPGKHGIGSLVPWVSPFLHSVLYKHRARSTAMTTTKSWPAGPALRLSAPPMVKEGSLHSLYLFQNREKQPQKLKQPFSGGSSWGAQCSTWPLLPRAGWGTDTLT